MIKSAIQLTKEITLKTPSPKGTIYHHGSPGDYLVSTTKGTQSIIPGDIFEEIVLASSSCSPTVETALILIKDNMPT